MYNAKQQQVLAAMVVGLEFEFYSNKARKDVAKEIGQAVNKKIVVGEMYHSDTAVIPGQWKLEPDFSGGVKMNELITDPMGYYESMAVLPKILSWIRDNGWTDEKCAVHLNISFNKFKIDMRQNLEGINKLKFVLGFDEDFIYSKFPKRKNSIYARSINSIFPINKFVFSDNVDLIYPENYELPNEKYYGVNFSKLSNGYVEIRYAGGRNYEKKGYDLVDIINYVGLFCYDTLQNNNVYTDSEISKLRNAMREHKKVVSSFSDLESYLINYPNLNLMVDLKTDVEVLKTFYPALREKIFDLIIRCGIRKGMINYDSDLSRYQLKDAVTTKAFALEGLEVFDTKIQGNVINCHLYRCDIKNAHIIDSMLMGGNMVKRSKVINTPIQHTNELEDCYIDNKMGLINGKIIGGIIRSGEIGKLAEISKETEVINRMGDEKGGDKDRMGGNKDRMGGDKDRAGGNKDRMGGNKDRIGGNKDRMGGAKDRSGGGFMGY